MHNFVTAVLFGTAMFVLAACGGEDQVRDDSDDSGDRQVDEPSLSDASDASDASYELGAFRAALRNSRTDCATLYERRNDARAAGAVEFRQRLMNEDLREVGCFSSTSTRRAEPTSSPTPRARPPSPPPESEDEARIQELCDAYNEALLESAGPPIMSDRQAYFLFLDVARDAEGTPLESAIMVVAQGFRQGADYIDGGPVSEICD